jgi:hypothetical protein
VRVSPEPRDCLQPHLALSIATKGRSQDPVKCIWFSLVRVPPFQYPFAHLGRTSGSFRRQVAHNIRSLLADEWMQRSRAAAPSGFDLYLNDLAFKRCDKVNFRIRRAAPA